MLAIWVHIKNDTGNNIKNFNIQNIYLVHISLKTTAVNLGTK
jgi:hypothetical protein